MFGFGSPSGTTPDTSLGPSGNELAVFADHFDWGFGDPEPTAWAGDSEEWGFGEPSPLKSDHISWFGTTLIPDDGGSIALLIADWPEIGPWKVKCIHSETDQVFPQATDSLLYCNSPVPGLLDNVYTNVVKSTVAGVTMPTAGTQLRFVIPSLPPGIYDLELHNPGNPEKIKIENIFRVVWRNRSQEVYAIRNRWPLIFEAGQRTLRFEEMLGYDSETESG